MNKQKLQNRLLAVLAGLVAVLFLSLRGMDSSAVESTQVRIAVLKDVKDVKVRILGPFSLTDPLQQKEIRGGRRLNETLFSVTDKGLRMGDQNLLLNRVRLIPNWDVTVLVNGKERRYRGAIDIIKTPENKILVVNTLGLEEYIQGVLYHEISHRWPLDAIMAQAVATRSYAIYQILNNKAKDFDVYSDIYSQVYGGKTSEKYRTNLAVERTKGQVLVFKGKILPAYFHATCAGWTEDVRELWNHPNLPPLEGVRCNFCFFSPHRYWKKNIQLKEIQALLNKNGYDLDTIADIAVVDTDPSGRIRNLKITSRSGKMVTVSGKDFRQMVGPNMIRSNKYRVVMRGYYCDFLGEGWGHGVGLCQWGAYGMARQRYDYRAILSHYYPGSALMDVRTLDLSAIRPDAQPPANVGEEKNPSRSSAF